MKILYFAIYDEKSEAYMQPFPNQTKGSAIRSFGDTVADEKSSLHVHPEDYSLVYLGKYDDHTGKYEQPEVPEVIAKAKDFVEVKE